MTTETALVEAVRELKQVTQALTDVLRSEYPKRTEIEERFATKHSALRRLRYFVAFTLLALFTSYFVAISTVSACFLGNKPHPAACSAIPGYEESQDRRIEHEAEHIKLERRIDRLEKRIRR